MKTYKRKEIKPERNIGHPTDEQAIIEQRIREKWESLRPSFLEWAKENGESPLEFDMIVDGQVLYARVIYQKKREESELSTSLTIWDQISSEDADALQALLDTNPNESSMQRFLEEKPKFLVQVLAGGHGRYQLSQKRLGSQYVPDFLVAESSSIGIEWYAIEIESPRSKEHLVDGNPASALNIALSQIRDWRQWLMDNIDYARRPKEQNGLGLIGIDSRVPGLIIIGRRHEYPERFNHFRRNIRDRENILIHSYDWLVDVARSNTSGWLRENG